MDDQPTTYVLVGFDNEDEAKIYQNRRDCTVIRYDDVNGSIADALKDMHTPCTILVLCHGDEDGMMQWRENEWIPYSEAFKAFPEKDVNGVMLYNCKSGTAERKALDAAPNGALVMSTVSEISLASSTQTAASAHSEETADIARPADYLLKAYDNFNAELYGASIARANKENHTKEDTNPMHALPHLIGIGGKPPITIELNDELAKLAAGAKEKALDPVSWKRAIARVNERFDSGGMVAFTKGADVYRPRSMNGDREVQGEIAAVVAALEHGTPLASTLPGADDKKIAIDNAREKSIALALTVAYLDESGKIGQWTDRVKMGKQLAQIAPKGVTVENDLTEKKDGPHDSMDEVVRQLRDSMKERFDKNELPVKVDSQQPGKVSGWQH